MLLWRWAEVMAWKWAMAGVWCRRQASGLWAQGRFGVDWMVSMKLAEVWAEVVAEQGRVWGKSLVGL